MFRVAEITALIDEEMRMRGSVDADVLHDHGCTFDTSGLPDHISNMADIECYIADVLQLLTVLKVKPKIITASRYCIQF